MEVVFDAIEVDQNDLLAADRARIVRLCARLTGDARAAEDLAQETLLLAFRQEQALRDPTRRAQWLSGIARNLCLHWWRRKGQERRRFVQPRSSDDSPGLEDDDLLADDFDMETSLEKSELADLLDRALALLPADTRAVLVERYFREAPHADVAARLGLNEGAVKKRVERGKLALRRLLTTELRDEALAYGLISPETEGWQPTRIWCPGCGKQRLEGRLRPEAGELDLRCPACSPVSHFYYIRSQGKTLKGLRAYKPATSRVLEVIHDRYRVHSVDGATRCPGCGRWTRITRETTPVLLPEGTGYELIHLSCPACGFHNIETWHSLTWSVPAARNFWRENPRMRFLPARETEVAGRPAILTGFESLTGRARIEVVSSPDTYKILRIDETP